MAEIMCSSFERTKLMLIERYERIFGKLKSFCISNLGKTRTQILWNAFLSNNRFKTERSFALDTIQLGRST